MPYTTQDRESDQALMGFQRNTLLLRGVLKSRLANRKNKTQGDERQAVIAAHGRLLEWVEAGYPELPDAEGSMEPSAEQSATPENAVGRPEPADEAVPPGTVKPASERAGEGREVALVKVSPAWQAELDAREERHRNRRSPRPPQVLPPGRLALPGGSGSPASASPLPSIAKRLRGLLGRS